MTSIDVDHLAQVRALAIDLGLGTVPRGGLEQQRTRSAIGAGT